MPPARKAPRCVYAEGRQRCKRKGTGSPSLCEAHRIVLEAEASRPERPGEKVVNLLGRIFRGQKINDDHLYAGLEDLAGMFTRAPNDPPQSPLDAARARAQDFFRRNRSAAPGPMPPPPPRPRKPAGPNPYMVLGFAVGQKLTVDDVKKRHRELARQNHPDKGGSTKRMAEINHAVDQLLTELQPRS